MIAQSGLRPAFVRLGVGDLATAARFYRDAFGLELTNVGDEVHALFPGFKLVLEFAPPAERGKFMLAFQAPSADDVDEIASRVRAAGGAVVSGPELDRGSRRVIVADPDHYSIEIFS
jgi:predicted enzyme related to lactoylglutathione lyase